MSKWVIETRDLRKEFDDKTAVDNLNLEVPSGSIFGFLGPNGAGKTTTLRMLVGLAKPTSGQVLVLGEDVTRSKKYLEKVSFLPDLPNFYNWMTAREYLSFVGEIFALDKKELGKKIEELLSLVGLSKEKNKIGKYSRGMKQRLGLAQALVNDPQILLMDEPTSALDPIGRKEILETIKDFRGRVTVLFSTHVLADVERICDEVAILDSGKLIAKNSIHQLRQNYGTGAMEIIPTEITPSLLDKLNNLPWVLGVSQEGETLKISVTEKECAYHGLVEFFSQEGLGLKKLEETKVTLEDIFVKLVDENEI